MTDMPRRKFLGTTAGAVAITAMATVPAAASPTVDSANRGKPTIVLVHGAFADGSSWNDVVERLERRGYKVIAVANPLRSVASDAAYVKALLHTIDGPVVLAGHSYGGMVISNAAVGEANVKALVYIAGFIPEQGESAGDLAAKFPGSTLGETLVKVPLPGGGNDLYVRQDLYPRQFAADVPKARARVAAATQRPVTENGLGDASGPVAWHTIPSWSLIPTADKNIPPNSQRFMSQRAKAHAVEVPGASHAVLVSQPGRTADLIVAAAGSVR